MRKIKAWLFIIPICIAYAVTTVFGLNMIMMISYFISSMFLKYLFTFIAGACVCFCVTCAIMLAFTILNFSHYDSVEIIEVEYETY